MAITYADTRTLLWMAASLYLFSFLFAFLSTLNNRSSLRFIFYGLLIIGFIFQSAGLYFRGLFLSTFPLTNLFEILQVTAWGITLLIFVIQLGVRLRSLDLFGSGLITLLTIASLAIQRFDAHPSLAKISQLIPKTNPWIEIHAALAIFAYSVFGLLAITSLMFLLQDYSLARKRFSRFFHLLPSLKQLGTTSHILLLMGVITLGVSVILGTLTWASQVYHVTPSKLTCAWILFIGYLLTFILKQKDQCLPRTAAWSCFFLFLFALITLWPVYFSLPS